MKKKIITAAAFLTALLIALPISAAPNLPLGASNNSSTDIPIGSSGNMTMVGNIKPNILSVTVPTYVPFDISYSIEGENKVISPRIAMKNNASAPVDVKVVYAAVDMKNFKTTTWSDTGTVNDNQIAIGFKEEMTENEMPSDLSNSKWLTANQTQDSTILSLGSRKTGITYVVGRIGTQVNENASFTVVPTFIVSPSTNTN